MPDGNFTVTFRECLFEDKILATQRYPEKNPGYSVRQLLMCMCITEVNGNPVGKALKDPTALLKRFTISDSQCIQRFFNSLSFLSTERSAEAKAVAKRIKDKAPLADVYDIAKESFPTKSHSIKFRRVMDDERMACERIYPANDPNCGYAFEDLLTARAIVEIDGVEQKQNTKEDVDIFAKWKSLDQEFAMAIYISLFAASLKQLDNVEELGKTLLADVYGNSGDAAA